MINLLPPQEKQRLAQAETERMLVIWGFIIAVFLISFILTLLVVNVQIKGRADAQEILLQGLRQELEDPSVAQLKKELISANQLVARVEPVLAKHNKVSPIFDLIAGYLPSGVYITRLSYNDSPRSITLEGFSPTRQMLLTLKSNLESEKLFSKVDFPPSNWIKSENIDFIVNLTLTDNGN